MHKQMERLILIETSTALCSTALSEDGKIVSYKESGANRAHASLTAVFVDEMLKERGCLLKDCDAVCVSMGPGSYTGLRVGVSTAKGLCFGAGLPLLAVGTLDTLVAQAREEGLIPEGCKYVIPMVDARRMEVYTAVFTPEGRQVTETEPLVVEAGAFADRLAEGPVLFVGDGAGKCEEVLAHANAHFAQLCPKASAMLAPARTEYKEKRFKDVAYFEPFYLKEFVATVSRKKLF